MRQEVRSQDIKDLRTLSCIMAHFPHRKGRNAHVYGEEAGHFRGGQATATLDVPPSWSPERAEDPVCPYSLEDWQLDLRHWIHATKVAPERQGNIIALQLGGSTRLTVEENIAPEALSNGMVFDFQDGWVQFIILAHK